MGVHAESDDYDEAAALLEKGDYVAALARYRMLAERGSATAQVFLGWMHQLGRGVERDLEEAARWYKKAADAGSAEGQFYLGTLLCNQEEYQQAIAWLERAASQDYMPAIFRLGKMYDIGSGVTRDPEKAYRYLVRAARMGHLFAQRHIAGKMIRGRFGAKRIPEGLYNLGRVLWSAWRLASRDRNSDRIRW